MGCTNNGFTRRSQIPASRAFVFSARCLFELGLGRLSGGQPILKLLGGFKGHSANGATAEVVEHDFGRLCRLARPPLITAPRFFAISVAVRRRGEVECVLVVEFWQRAVSSRW